MYGSLTNAPQLPSLSEDSHNKVIPLWKVADYTVFLWGKTFPIQYLLCPVFIIFSGCDDTNIISCLLGIIQQQRVKIKIKYRHTGHWSTIFQDILCKKRMFVRTQLPPGEKCNTWEKMRKVEVVKSWRASGLVFGSF